MVQAQMELEGKVIRLIVEQDELADDPRSWDNLGKMICFHSRYNLGDKHSYSNPEEFIGDLLQEMVDKDDAILDESVKRIVEQVTISYHEGEQEWVIGYKDETLDYFEHEKDARDSIEDVVREYVNENYNYLLTLNEKKELVAKEHVMLPLYLYDHSGITMNTTGFSCSWDSGQVGWIYASRETFINDTGYTESELFNADKNRLPQLQENVKLKGHEEKGHYGFGKVIELKDETVTVDFDYFKTTSFRSEENIVTVPVSEIEEVYANYAEEILISEVKEYDQYLRGDVFHFTLEEKEVCSCCDHEKWKHIDSCGGFYGSNWEENGIKDHVGKEYEVLVEQLG